MSYPSQQLRREPPRPLSEAELRARFDASFPEGLGPGTDTEGGTVLYGQPGHPRIGHIPPLLDPELRDKENAERERAQAALTPEVKAAMALIEQEMQAERRWRP